MQHPRVEQAGVFVVGAVAELRQQLQLQIRFVGAEPLADLRRYQAILTPPEHQQRLVHAFQKRRGGGGPGAQGHADAHRPQGPGGPGTQGGAGHQPAQFWIERLRIAVGAAQPQIQQWCAGNQGHQQLQGQQPAHQHHPMAAQSPPPAGAAPPHRHQQGGIGQRGRHHRLHPHREEHGAGDGHQAAERVAHQHRRPFHHLLEEGLQLPGPEPIVERAVAPVPRLAGGAEAQQIDRVHAPAGCRQLAGIVAPVAAGGAEAMEQHQGRQAPIAQHPPVAGMPLPVPGAVLTPVSPGRGRRRLAGAGQGEGERRNRLGGGGQGGWRLWRRQ